eukprot:7753537-Pyramimonas_sp.AAC.1
MNGIGSPRYGLVAGVATHRKAGALVLVPAFNASTNHAVAPSPSALGPRRAGRGLAGCEARSCSSSAQ